MTTAFRSLIKTTLQPESQGHVVPKCLKWMGEPLVYVLFGDVVSPGVTDAAVAVVVSRVVADAAVVVVVVV